MDQLYQYRTGESALVDQSREISSGEYYQIDREEEEVDRMSRESIENEIHVREQMLINDQQETYDEDKSFKVDQSFIQDSKDKASHQNQRSHMEDYVRSKSCHDDYCESNVEVIVHVIPTHVVHIFSKTQVCVQIQNMKKLRQKMTNFFCCFEMYLLWILFLQETISF